MATLSGFGRDVRHGVRTLGRTPTFTIIAMATMALAIGANTAIFSLVDPLVFRDLPVREPGRLVEFVSHYPGDPPMNAFSLSNYDGYRTQNTVFADLMGTGPVPPATDARGESLDGDYVTGNFFPALGVRAAWGRLIAPQDDQPGATAVAVLSWACWRNRFNLDPGILGREISVGGIPATVIGIAHRSFSGLVVGYKQDAWIPAAAYPARRGFMVVARLKEGASIERAQAEMRVLDRPRIEAFALRDPQWRTVTLDVRSARAGLTTPLHQQFAKPLVVLLGIVGVLVLLAAANIGSLLLARAAGRRHEMAIRLALGAGRFRIVRYVLIESILLATAGSVLGIAGAYFGSAFLVRIMGAGTRLIGPPPQLDVTIDGRVLLFTAAVTLLAAVLFGLTPAWAAFATPAVTLKEGGGAGQPRSRRLFGNGLVVAQVGLSLVLLSVSGLYVSHLSALRDRELGFNRKSVLLVSLDLGRAGTKREQIGARYPELLARLHAIPGVVSSTVSGMIPMSGAAWTQFATVEGFQEAPEARRRLSINDVAPDYFATWATRLIGGRDFRTADAKGPRVAIVNEALARYYFANGNPIGKLIALEGQPQPFEVIGLVADAKYNDIRGAAPRTLYLDYAQLPAPPQELSLRTTLPPMQIAGDVRRVIGDVLGGAPVKNVTTLADHVDAAIVPERLIATLSGFFGTVGVLLAALGLYGLLAYTVTRRTNEIGLRMALGAARSDVLRLILRDAFWLVCAGLLIGAPVAILTKRLAASMVENLSPGGMLPIVAAAVVTIAVGVIAAYVPARRAALVDPLIALRSE